MNIISKIKAKLKRWERKFKLKFYKFLSDRKWLVEYHYEIKERVLRDYDLCSLTKDYNMIKTEGCLYTLEFNNDVREETIEKYYQEIKSKKKIFDIGSTSKISIRLNVLASLQEIQLLFDDGELIKASNNNYMGMTITKRLGNYLSSEYKQIHINFNKYRLGFSKKFNLDIENTLDYVSFIKRMLKYTVKEFSEELNKKYPEINYEITGYKEIAILPNRFTFYNNYVCSQCGTPLVIENNIMVRCINDGEILLLDNKGNFKRHVNTQITSLEVSDKIFFTLKQKHLTQFKEYFRDC